MGIGINTDGKINLGRLFTGINIQSALVTKDRANAILWNKVGSTAESTNSEIGPNMAENGTVLYTPNGKFGGAFNQDLANNNLTIPSFPAITTDLGSLDFWVQPKGWDMVNGDPSDNNNHQWWISRITSNKNMSLSNGSGVSALIFSMRINGVASTWQAKDSGIDAPRDVWTHLAVAWDRTHATKKRIMFVNGIEVGSNNASWGVADAGTKVFYMGTNNAGSNPFLGYMDNPYAWSTYKTDWSQRGIE